MSMICWLLGVSPAQIMGFEKTPTLAGDAARVASDDARKERMAPYLAAMTPEQRRFHDERERADRKTYPELEQAEIGLRESRNRIASLAPFERALCLEKSWQMLHYLMTSRGFETLHAMAMGHVAAAPGDELLTGASLGDDVGYGPARLHDVKAAAGFARFLETQDVATLQRRVNLATMSAEQIYGMPIGPGADAAYEADLRAEVAHFFPLLRDYVAEAARKQHGLLVWLN